MTRDTWEVVTYHVPRRCPLTSKHQKLGFRPRASKFTWPSDLNNHIQSRLTKGAGRVESSPLFTGHTHVIGSSLIHCRNKVLRPRKGCACSNSPLPHLLDIKHRNKEQDTVLSTFKKFTAEKPDRLQHSGGVQDSVPGAQRGRRG